MSPLTCNINVFILLVTPELYGRKAFEVESRRVATRGVCYAVGEKSTSPSSHATVLHGIMFCLISKMILIIPRRGVSSYPYSAHLGLTEDTPLWHTSFQVLQFRPWANHL